MYAKFAQQADMFLVGERSEPEKNSLITAQQLRFFPKGKEAFAEQTLNGRGCAPSLLGWLHELLQL